MNWQALALIGLTSAFNFAKKKTSCADAFCFLFNYSAADYDIAVVEHDRLPLADSALRLVKDYADPVAVRLRNGRGLFLLVIAHSRADPHFAFDPVGRNQVDIGRRKLF